MSDERDPGDLYGQIVAARYAAIAARLAALETVAELGHAWWNAQADADTTRLALTDAALTVAYNEAVAADNAARAAAHNAEHRFWASLRALAALDGGQQ